jgi:protein-tyrosine-phosphatase
VTDVLFVCTANICRSAYAELRTRQLLPGLAVASAGVQGWRDHAMDRPIAQVLAQRGGDPVGFRSRRLQPPMIRDAQLVLTAEVKHRTSVLDDAPAAHARVFTLGMFAAAVADAPADLHGQDLVAWVSAQRRPMDGRLDIDDPYRRGLEAAVATADVIDQHLAVILPRLP